MQLLDLNSTVQVRREQLGMLSNNCYALFDGTTCVLVDPSCLPEKIILGLVKAGLCEPPEGLDPEAAGITVPSVLLAKAPAAIILTHCHFDHCGAAAQLAALWGIPVYASEADAPYIDGTLPRLSNMRPVEPVAVDFLVEDNDEFTIGTMTFKALLTPGHTPGSMCFLLDRGCSTGARPVAADAVPVLISGDTLFKETYGRVDFEEGSPADMKKSLERLSQLDPATLVLPGHGEATFIGAEKMNFFLAAREL